MKILRKSSLKSGIKSLNKWGKKNKEYLRGFGDGALVLGIGLSSTKKKNNKED